MAHKNTDMAFRRRLMRTVSLMRADGVEFTKAMPRHAEIIKKAAEYFQIDESRLPPDKKSRTKIIVEAAIDRFGANALMRKIKGEKSANDKAHHKASGFYSTYQWRKLRLIILEKYGRKCMCCGAGPEQGAVLNVDHIKPLKLFPELALDPNNLQVLCAACNHGKGNWGQQDFRPDGDDRLYDSVC